VVERFAAARLAVERFAGARFAVERFAVERFAVERFAVDRFAEARLAVERFAVERFAVERFAVERFAVDRFAEARLAVERFAVERFAVERFAVERLTVRRAGLGRRPAVERSSAPSESSSPPLPPSIFLATPTAAGIATPATAAPAATFCAVDRPSSSPEPESSSFSSSSPCHLMASFLRSPRRLLSTTSVDLVTVTRAVGFCLPAGRPRRFRVDRFRDRLEHVCDPVPDVSFLLPLVLRRIRLHERPGFPSFARAKPGDHAPYGVP